MKKIIYAIITLSTMFISSCSNADINIDKTSADVKNAVAVNVSLSNFYQSYDYKDNRFGINLQDYFKAFNSEYGHYIQVRTLFYKKSTGELQDSTIQYAPTVNNVLVQKDLPVGDYYVITTLSFVDKYNDKYYPYWDLENKENIKTAKMSQKYFNYVWSIMSESSEEFSVVEGKQANVSTTPAPVGSLCYFVMDNFCYKDEATYKKDPSVSSDNEIRLLALRSQQVSTEFNLDPKTSSKYNYWEDAGLDRWYAINYTTPTDEDENWEFFESQYIINYSYNIAPKFNLCFAYTKDGESSFNGYGEHDYTNQNGKVFLAYWDWFQVGNPYYGIADNNHWNDYSNEARSNNGVVSKKMDKSYFTKKIISQKNFIEK